MKRLLALLLAAFPCLLAFGEEGKPEDESRSGFVEIPAGDLSPGCTMKDFLARANDPVTRAFFIFEVWGSQPETVSLPAYRLQKYELTNAQWKLYLDRNFRVKVETNGQQTLLSLAEKHIRHDGEAVEGQWAAIYALNWKKIQDALKKADKWNANWTSERPGDEIRHVFLPEGLELHFYSHVLPKHWYGWCRLSGLSSGREYVDPEKAPKDAFRPPVEEEPFKSLRLRTQAFQKAVDYKNYPMRDIAPLEALAMAEWAGCNLPTEYELERAMRGAAPRTKQQPGAGPWDPRKQTDWFAFADNPLAARGPLPVDDPRVSKGDSEFGARHLLGNVWELTSTFWDLHPNLRPRPSLEVTEGLFNYALVAKGGAWGSGWRQVQISTRTGKFHHGLDLKFLNRADSLGLRLVRHHQPCYDLLSHTIRHMAYDNRLSRWQPKPHAYAMRRATGADVTHFVDSTAEEGYCHIQERAIGIGMAPVWVAQIDKLTVNRMKKVWKAQKKPKPDAIYLGAMRIDVPFKAGTRLKPTVWAKLQQDRKEYDKKRREVEMRNEKKKKKKKGEALEELPPKPPAPDKYEEATVKQEEMAGVWRESELPAGEYHVVYWYGFLGLQGKAKSVPPVAILIPEDVERERRLGDAKGKTLLDPEKDRADLTFYVEEWDRARPQNAVPPQEDQSELWALSKTLEEGWPDRKVNKAGWRFRVVIPFVAGELKKHKWNTEPRK